MLVVAVDLVELLEMLAVVELVQVEIMVEALAKTLLRVVQYASFGLV
jgi:hypothetical protein